MVKDKEIIIQEYLNIISEYPLCFYNDIILYKNRIDSLFNNHNFRNHYIDKLFPINYHYGSEIHSIIRQKINDIINDIKRYLYEDYDVIMDLFKNKITHDNFDDVILSENSLTIIYIIDGYELTIIIDKLTYEVSYDDSNQLEFINIRYSHKTGIDEYSFNKLIKNNIINNYNGDGMIYGDSLLGIPTLNVKIKKIPT